MTSTHSPLGSSASKWAINSEIKPPSAIYWHTCIQGYNDFRFDNKYLSEALKNSLS